MLSEGKNLSEKLKTNIIQYLFGFLEGDKALILSQINKKFKKSFLDFLLNSPDYEISYTIQKGTPINDLFLRVHLTELIFRDYQFSRERIEELKKRIRVNEITKIRVENCIFDAITKKELSSLNFMSYISKEFTNLSSLTITGNGMNSFQLNFEVFLKMGNLKHLSITNFQLKDNSLDAFNDFLYLKNLESLDLSNTLIKQGFLNSLLLSIDCFPNLKRLNFSKNEIGNDLAGKFIHHLGKSGKNFFIDLSENFIVFPEHFQNIYSNLTINLSNQRKQKMRVMRMLFSRSGEVNETFMKLNENQIEKRMGMKNNGAILPLYIYPHPSKITFNKEELRRILRIENSIRLSRESQLLYDTHKYSSLEDHLLLDKQIILQALIITGYNPQQDESLKAYHVATAKFINDEEVRNEVVWMKYDKCKVGRFQPGDKAVINNIDLFSLLGTKTHFAEVLSSIKPNVIVCGSLS